MRIKRREDSRGSLIELFKGKFSQCNLLIMKKGSIWGGHFHRKTKEYFYVIDGEILVEMSNLCQNRKSKKTYKKGHSFFIYPKMIHKIKVLKNAKCLVLYSKVFSIKKPDIYYK